MVVVIHHFTGLDPVWAPRASGERDRSPGSLRTGRELLDSSGSHHADLALGERGGERLVTFSSHLEHRLAWLFHPFVISVTPTAPSSL